MKFQIVLAAMLVFGPARTSHSQPTNAPPGNNAKAAEPTFRVTSYKIEGNTILSPQKFDFLTNYTGDKVSLARLRAGLGDLQLLYRNLGFATVSVTLPQQKLTNGIVRRLGH